jgi:hypothetical protein
MLNRRKFLYVSVGTVVLAGIPVSLKVFDRVDWPFGKNERELFGRIGENYFKLFPAEKDEDFLRQSISEAEKGNIQSRIAAEFSDGDSVVVGKWHLSRSEARIIALIALTKGYLPS